MPASASFSGATLPATPARAMRNRMQRRSSLVPTSALGSKRKSASPVKGRVLFPHRGRSSVGVSVAPATPRSGGGAIRRNRGRGSALFTAPMPPALETLEDQDEQLWWQELGEDFEPDKDLVQRLIDALYDQKRVHSNERKQAIQLIHAKDQAFQIEAQEVRRMHELQLQDEERRHQEALDVAEDEFSNQERILAATQKDNERLMIQIGLLQSSLDDSVYALAEAYGAEEWQHVLEKAAAERAGKADAMHPRVSFGSSTAAEGLHRSIQARSFVLHKNLPPIIRPREPSSSHGVSAGPASDPADESEVSMLLQSEGNPSLQETSTLAPSSMRGEDSIGHPLTFERPKRTPKKGRVSNMTAVTAETSMPFSSPQMDVSFNTAGDPGEELADTSVVAPVNGAEAGAAEDDVPVASTGGDHQTDDGETALGAMRLALLGLQRDIALDIYSRQEYFEQADEKIHALEELVSSLALGHGIPLPAMRGW